MQNDNNPQSTERYDWKTLEPVLLAMANYNIALRQIIKEEIPFFGNISSRFSRKAGVSHARVEEFLKKRAVMTGEQTLRGIATFCQHRHPQIVKLAENILNAKEKIPNGMGPVTLIEPIYLQAWITLMEIMFSMDLDRVQLAGQFREYSRAVYDTLTVRPPRKFMIRFEKSGKEIISILNDLDWNNIENLPVTFNPKKDRVDPARTPKPRKSGGRRSSKKTSQGSPRGVGGRPPTIVDSPEEAAEFNRLAKLCIEKYRTRGKVLEECVAKGIAIGSTSFSLANKKGRIGTAAREFIKLAPSLLLGEEATRDDVEQLDFTPIGSSSSPSMERNHDLHEDVPLTAQSYQEHDFPISANPDFGMVFTAELRKSIGYVNIAAQAKPEHRLKIVEQNLPLINELSTGLRALMAHNPLDVLQLLTQNANESGTKSRRRGHRTTK